MSTRTNKPKIRFCILEFIVYVLYVNFNLGKRHGLFLKNIQLNILLYLWLWLLPIVNIILEISGIHLYTFRELAISGRIILAIEISFAVYCLYVVVKKIILPEKRLLVIIKQYKSISFSKTVFVILYLLINIFMIGSVPLILTLYYHFKGV